MSAIADEGLSGGVRQAPPAGRWADEANGDPEQHHRSNPDPGASGGHRHELLRLVLGQREPGNDPGGGINGLGLRFGLAWGEALGSATSGFSHRVL